MTKTPIKNIVEAIDQKDISGLAENFNVAIAERVLKIVRETAEKAFDKEVEEIEKYGDEDDKKDEK